MPSTPLVINTEVMLLANDSGNNTTIYGYLANGAAQTITPAMIVAARPSTQQPYNYTGPNGTTVMRSFFGIESSNPTPLGTFSVAAYNETNATHVYGYAVGKGIVEEDHGPNFEVDCLIDAITIH